MKKTIETLDEERIELNSMLENKTEYSQYLTPVSIARFMASFFDKEKLDNLKILDAGAGIGILTAALLERLVTENYDSTIDCTFIEIDDILGSRIPKTLNFFREDLSVEEHIIIDDFIKWGVVKVDQQLNLFDSQEEGFSHAILNPPYKKMRSNSLQRRLLSTVGIETVNSYSAFVALTIKLLSQNGQVVAIIPRSFCNGPYYKAFREIILQETSIQHIHLFKSRNKAFKDDSVLQENIIIMLEKGAEQGDVKISTSTDDSLTDYNEEFIPFSKVVLEGDTEKFIHIPTDNEDSAVDLPESIKYTLRDLGVSVSTGPVVGFRKKEHLRFMPEDGTVPLLYPTHIEPQGVRWVKPDKKKHNAIMRNEETEKLLYPVGYYTIIRRRSAKEEKKRLISAVTVPEMFQDAEMLGFDNGLNVLHDNKNGLSKEVAYGLYVYLSSTLVDKYFRSFNGHTQVNATDLRVMLFPSIEKIICLGKWYISSKTVITQEEIDSKLKEVL